MFEPLFICACKLCYFRGFENRIDITIEHALEPDLLQKIESTVKNFPIMSKIVGWPHRAHNGVYRWP